MSRKLIMGKTGGGKTLTALRIMMSLHQKKGYKLYSNIHLNDVEYTYCEDSNPLKDINFQDKCVILIDEIGITTLGRGAHSTNFGKVLAQSRKSMGVGEKSILLMTCQTIYQIDHSILELIDEIYHVEHLVKLRPSVEEDPEQREIPIRSYVTVYDNHWNKLGIKKFNQLDIAMKYYSTEEMVDTFKDTRLMELKEKYPEYVGNSEMKVSVLADILYLKEGLNKSDSKTYSRAIIYDI